MNFKPICLFSVFIPLLTMLPAAFAVDARAIDEVRAKAVLSSADFVVIDNFVKQAVNEILTESDFTAVPKVWSILVSKSQSETTSQVQYREQFILSAKEQISSALRKLRIADPTESDYRRAVNLLIVVERLGDIQLAPISQEALGFENRAVSYWAVKSLSSDAVIEQLKTNKNASAAISNALLGFLPKAGEELHPMIASFGAKAPGEAGVDLLLKVTEIRKGLYTSGKVENELLDIDILKLLADKAIAGGSGSDQYAREFSQLYSYAVQRLVAKRESLNADAKTRLASVIAEVEITSISQMLGSRIPHITLRKALEANDYFKLLEEHNKLFGDETRPGEIPTKFGFDYGKNQDGSKRMSPIKLE